MAKFGLPIGQATGLLLVAVFLAACGGGGGVGGGGDDPGEDELPTPTVRWTSLDASRPPGSSAVCVVDSARSDAQRTVFTIEIPGFWMEDKEGPDGRTYQWIRIPGLGSHETVGVPDLPLVHSEFATPTTATRGVVTEVQWNDARVFQNVLVWPQPVPATDRETGGEEVFSLDRTIYEDWNGDWPATPAVPDLPVVKTLRSIPTVKFTAPVVRWNPQTRALRVPRSVTCSVEHTGDVPDFSRVTFPKERLRNAGHRYPNWAEVAELFPREEKVMYRAHYLFYYPQGYEEELAPLVAEKRTRGFQVMEAYAPSSGFCSSTRAFLQAWVNTIPVWQDAYCLLVGDVDTIPLCWTTNGLQTDDLYGSPGGADLDEEVYVGRLSVDSQEDCANQVAKILAYGHGSRSVFHERVLLWAHAEDAPGKYEGAHESVRTAMYSTPPEFHTMYGSRTGSEDDDVVASVNGGLGLLAYRGHGTWEATAYK